MYPWQASPAIFKNAYNILAFFLDALPLSGLNLFSNKFVTEKYDRYLR